MQLPQRFIYEGSDRPMAMFARAQGIHDPAPLSIQPFARDMLLGDRIIDEQWRADIELLLEFFRPPEALLLVATACSMGFVN